MKQPPRPPGRYVFGTSDAEIARLQQLGELLQPSTRQVLREAGVAEGMSVLDVGCGPGPVSFLAAELAGPTGSIVGIDNNPAMLATARAHALARGAPIVSFLEADLTELGAEAKRWAANAVSPGPSTWSLPGPARHRRNNEAAGNHGDQIRSNNSGSVGMSQHSATRPATVRYSPTVLHRCAVPASVASPSARAAIVLPAPVSTSRRMIRKVLPARPRRRVK